MSSKIISKILMIGTGAALIIGYVLAGKKDAREKLTQHSEGLLNFLCDLVEKGKEKIKEYSENAADDIREGMLKRGPQA